VSTALVKGGARGVAPKRYLEEPRFLEQMKDLFWANQEREEDAYDRAIYQLYPPGSTEQCQRLLQFRQLGELPSLGKEANIKKVQKVMRTIRYPQVEPLMELADIEGMTMRHATTLLHFHHPAYPFFTPAVVEGLHKVGMAVVFRDEMSEEALLDYEGLMATLDRLKDDVTFENVPESNCFLTRVLEGALVEYARVD